MPTPENFQVDLRGLVRLLSQNLYSTPAVYLRELLQNGVDAITARHEFDPNAPQGRILIETPAANGDRLRVTDNGIGLTGDEMRELLATIGASSKRDELDFGRTQFLGQFGIGLLSTFLACERAVVLSRSARTPDAPTMRWTASSDGTFAIDQADADEALAEPGTAVLLDRGQDSHLQEDGFVTETLRRYGEMLPVDIGCRTADGDLAITGKPRPWEASAEEAAAYAEETFGFTPLAQIPLQVPVAGVRGVAFVRPTEGAPGSRNAQRAYLKGMLLAENVEGLLPDWCFFTQGVFEVSGLRPTASREALYADELLDDVAETLGDQVVAWLTDMAERDLEAMDAFMAVHHRQVMAMALHHDAVLDLARRWVRMETTDGLLTIPEFRARHDTVRYARTVDQFRGVAAVAEAQGIGVVNVGHTWEFELLERLGEADGFRPEPVDPAALALALDVPSDAVMKRAEPFLASVRQRLTDRACEVALREFQPATLSALYLPDPDVHGRHLRASARELDGVLGELMGALEEPEQTSRPAYVLNSNNTLVNALLQLSGGPHAEMAAEIGAGLYAQALLTGHHPMDGTDQALLSRTFMMLINRVVDGADGAR